MANALFRIHLPRLLPLLALSLAAGSCAQPLAPASAATGLASIESLIGTAACRSTADCRVIGVGASACGGPAGYRAWSVTQTDAAALEQAVSEDAQAQRQELERLGMRSTCAIRPVPGTSCSRSDAPGASARCVLLAPATSSQ